MPIPGFLLSLVLLVGMMTPGDATAAPSQTCADLEVYLTTAGEHIRDHLASLLADDEWFESFEQSTHKANEPGMGILALDSDEIAPIIALIAVPGDALRDIPDDDVPPIARELHDSALDYHQSMPAMLEAASRGGAMAAMPFSDTFDEATASNRSAQQMVRDTCPSLVDTIASYSDTNDVLDLNEALTDPESLNPDMLADIAPEGLRALSFSMLFFTVDDEEPSQQPPSDAPPVDQASDEGRKGIARIGDPAPDFAMTTFDGETFRLSDHRGEVVIINFWGSWCEPCREEMPAFQQAWEAADDDVTFVGVGSKRDRDSEAIAFADEFGVTYPIGRDTEGGNPANGQITLAYNILVFPTTYIVDPEGNISAIVMYAMDMDDLAGYIDQARNP